MTTQHAAPGRPTPWSGWPILLCWIAVALDGFDLVVLGTAIPVLTSSHQLGFDDGSATFVATIGLVGVGIGAILVGPIADRYGRRGPLMASVLVFSVCTLGIAVSSSVLMFGGLRFAAGLGLGACFPTALAYMSELSSPARKARALTRTMTGYHVGAVLTALIAILILPEWRLMFCAGGLGGLLLLPLLWFKLPESTTFAVTGRAEDAPGASRVGDTRTQHGFGELRDPADTASGGIGALLRQPYRMTSIAVWGASFMGLLLVYGLNTWLPQLMRAAGYALGDSLIFLLVLNLGAVTGLLIAGGLADSKGSRRVAMIWFFFAAVFLIVLSIRIESVFVLYLGVFITGVFVFSAQVLVYALVSQRYPSALRGRALGAAAGIGRVGAIVGPALTGTLVTLGAAYPGGFYVFAAAASIGVIALALVPREPAPVGVDRLSRVAELD